MRDDSAIAEFSFFNGYNGLSPILRKFGYIKNEKNY